MHIISNSYYMQLQNITQTNITVKHLNKLHEIQNTYQYKSPNLFASHSVHPLGVETWCKSWKVIKIIS